MDEDVEYSIKDLEKCSYRGLQQFAKSLQLPSNVKKLDLIQLIHTKKHCSKADLEELVQRVRLERLLAAQASKRKGKKKMRPQGTEVSSTTHSPPISSTPKRPGRVICNPFKKILPRPQISREFSKRKRDRVLRSFNMNSYKRPRKLTPSTSGWVSCLKENLLASVSSREVCLNLSNNRPKTPEASVKDSECGPSFGFRIQDEKISKINAMVQKPGTKPVIETTSRDTCSSIEVRVQDIINSNIDSHLFTDTTTLDYGFSDPHYSYPHISNATDYSNETEVETTQNCDMKHENPSTEKGADPEESFSIDFHNKIRARETEQVKQRMQKPVQERERDRLPPIAEVFTTFQNRFWRDVTEPLYVQVSEHSERMYDPDKQYQSAGEGPTRVSEYLQCTEQEITLRMYLEAKGLSPSSSSSPSPSPVSQDADAAAGPSTTEMVEVSCGRRRLISQDGDNVERISMDVRMQCILCYWTGPKSGLDLHVEKEHASDIVKQGSSDWNTTYRLGTLSDQPLWLSEVREFDDRRYALSVKWEANWMLVSLSTLTLDPDPKKGTITIYNQVTGEPYVWEGPMQLLPTKMPYEHEGSYLRVSIEQLDLVPSSEHIVTRNSELKNTNKVVGKIDLNEVYVIIFVKISESD